MNQEEGKLKDSFQKELEKLKGETVLSPEYRRKKTVIWAIRTAIALTLFIIFWKHQWVRWLLIAYIPLNLFGLLMIYGGNVFLHTKIAKTESKIDEAEKLMEEVEDD